MPRSNGVRASKPKRSLRARHVEPAARLAVRLAGVPDEAALVARPPCAIFCGQIADRDLLAAAQVDRVAGVVTLGREHDALGRVLDVEELARRRAVAPQHHLAVTALARADELADHGRDDVRRLQIEVVARPVQVHREQHDAVHAVLLAVRLRLHQHHLLGDAVGGVGLLRVAVPEIVLLERDGRELRIGADGAERDQLRDLGEAALLEQLQPHHRVLEQVAAGVVAVRADAADLRGEVDDQVGARVGEQAAGGRAIDQIVVGANAGRRRARRRGAERSTTKLPRKPAPPVTTTCLSCQNERHMAAGNYHEPCRRTRTFYAAATRVRGSARRARTACRRRPRRPAPSARGARRRGCPPGGRTPPGFTVAP